MVSVTLLVTYGNGQQHCGIQETPTRAQTKENALKKVAHFCVINRIVIDIVVLQDLKIPKIVQQVISDFDVQKVLKRKFLDSIKL